MLGSSLTGLRELFGLYDFHSHCAASEQLFHLIQVIPHASSRDPNRSQQSLLCIALYSSPITAANLSRHLNIAGTGFGCALSSRYDGLTPVVGRHHYNLN
jgi:hypothetical protein